MRDQMQDGMAEATRLTREGRLAEATAAIQHALGGAFGDTFGGTFAPAASPGDADEQTATARRVVDGDTRHTAPSKTDPTNERALRPAPRPPRRFRGMSHPSGRLPGTMPEAPEEAPAIVSAGGRFVQRSYTNRAGTRAYKLYVPSGYTGQQAVPLIVMLHGCTQDPDDIAAGTHMNALAEEHTFLVAYPAQSQNANVSRCWNWFESGDQRRGRGDASLVAGITCEVLGEHHVAADRVYAAGMSAGGAMAAIMGATYPDLYAAVGVHSGLAPGAAQDLSSAFAAMRGGSPGRPVGGPPDAASNGEFIRAVPVIIFHGDRDTTVHPRNADHLLAYYRDARGGPAPRATTRRGQVPGGHAYTRATYHDAGGRAIAERWTVHGLGHAWSGGSRPGSYTDPKGPDASAEMVRFFLQHPRPEPTG